MGDIRRNYDSGSGDPDPGAFLQCVNGREPMVHKFWCHRVDRLCREVFPTARIDIPAGTIIEFVTEYLSADGRCNRIIGELSINESLQSIRLSEIWGSGLPYIFNHRAPEATRVWGSTGFTNPTGIWCRNSVNPGSTNYNGI